MKGETILISGMSGISIEKCLTKFISEFKEFRTTLSNQKPVLIKLDTEIEKVYYQLNPSEKKSNQIWKDVILKQTYPVLQLLWNKAFENVKARIEEIRKEKPTTFIFVNMHSCYYHNRTQEYIPLVNIKELSDIEPTKVITLIDDIYEIHHRLTFTGGIYHDEKNVSNTVMILRLLRLLDWRAKETMLSRHIANQLNIKNYVFSVKHSFDTFSNLIFKSCQKVYLSHPITEVRRLEKNNKLADAKQIMNEITEISDRLSYEFTTFLPTTIDEFRILFKLAEDGETKNYYSVLTKRWEDQIYAKPKDLLYLNSGFSDTNALWTTLEPSEIKLNEQINHLLEALSDFISDQVTVRDYTLVEQSDMLVIYRPLFNGNASGGVREEFRYYKRLIKDSGKNILCFIYCPDVDIKKYHIRQFELKVINEIQEESLKFNTNNSSTFQLSNEECEQLLTAIDNNNLILDVLDKVMDNHKIEFNIKNPKTPLSPNKINEFRQIFAEEVILLYQSINEYKEDVTYFENDQIEIEQFINNIKNHLKS
ncbi:MAG: hypothetical protein QM541_00895 [Flavobacterium sp.]|nr:hypothetical protein [Flavobacterium sp.]